MNILKKFKKAIHLFKHPSLVLMYHRVATPSTDVWELGVSPSNFEQQLKVLKDTGLVVPMEQLIEQITLKKIRKPFIILTFDDGYADNYIQAKPLLEKYEMPATFFIPNKHLGQKKEFWWDELENLVLHTNTLPRHLSLYLKSRTLNFDLEDEIILTETINIKHQEWNAYLEPPTQRSKLYIELWELLSPLQYNDQQSILAILRQWAGISEQPRTSYYPMTIEQLQELAGHELFTIGGHTESHPALAYQSTEFQHQEIAQNKQFLEATTGSAIDCFAYPSGSYNKITAHTVKQENFRVAFTTHQQLVNEKTDPYQIGRFQVNNWSGPEFKKILLNWI